MKMNILVLFYASYSFISFGVGSFYTCILCICYYYYYYRHCHHFFLLLLIITKPCQLFCTLIFRNYLNKCFCMGLLYIIRYRKVLYHILIDCSSFLVLCYLSRGLEPVSNLKFCWRNVH